jgi:hypothetical protein
LTAIPLQFGDHIRLKCHVAQHCQDLRRIIHSDLAHIFATALTVVATQYGTVPVEPRRAQRALADFVLPPADRLDMISFHANHTSHGSVMGYTRPLRTRTILLMTSPQGSL